MADVSDVLLPLPAPASPSTTRGGAGPRGVQIVRRPAQDADLSLLDFTARLRRQLFNFLLRLQIKHDVSELLLQLGDHGVLTFSCRGQKDETTRQSHGQRRQITATIKLD